MNFVNAYLTHNRPGNKRRRTTAIAIHWVANPGTSAMANRNYFNNTDRSVSSNYIIGLTGEIVRCIPHGEESWCTNQANPYTVSIECCHPDWTGKFNDATYNAAVELCAELCKIYGLNPTNGGLIRHYDVTKKVCPKWFVPASAGGTDTNDEQHWKKFKNDVAAKMGNKTTASNSSTVKPSITVEQAAKNVIAGKYGNGEDRKKRIAALGLDYNTVQARVNQLLGIKTATTTHKPATPASNSSSVKPSITVEQAAKDVIAGKYGNGEDRKKRIAALGLDYNTVQARVNQLLGIKTTTAVHKPAAPASNTKVAAAKSKSDSIRGTYSVTATSLYCRYIPGKLTSDNVVTAFKNGTKVHCYGYYTTVNNSKWYLVQSGKHTGYCNSKYLKKV